MIPISKAGRSKRSGIPTSALYVVILVLATLTVFIGGSLWHTRSNLADYSDQLIQMGRKLKTAEAQTKQQRTSISQLEAKIRQLDASLLDANRDLRMRDADLQALEEQKLQAESVRTNREVELEAKLEFEKTVVETLNASITQMESAHNAREADWHELSARWMQFEKELTGDNERLLAELASHQETKDAAASGGFVHSHEMPTQEPLEREETEFKPRKPLPREDEFLARQRQLMREQDRLRKQQEELALQRERAGLRRDGGGLGRRDMGGMGRKGAFVDSGREVPAQEGEQHQGGPYNHHQHHPHHGEAGDPHHGAPDIGHIHHDDHYDTHDPDDWGYDDDHPHRHWDDDYHPDAWDEAYGWDEHGWDGYDEDYAHLDPLDEAWIHDDVDFNADNWPGSHPPPEHHHHGQHHQHHQQHAGGAEGLEGGDPAGSHAQVHAHDEAARGGAQGGVPLPEDDGKVGGPQEEELPVLGRDPAKATQQQQQQQQEQQENEIPVLGRDPAKGGAREGWEEAKSNWQRMQEAAMPGRYRHG